MTISVVIPTYNEEENVMPLSVAVINLFKEQLPSYSLELLFIDNCSQDNTQAIIRDLCVKDKRIKAIFNTRNFGPLNSPYYGLIQATGDCAILLCADFQDPVDLIPEFVKAWEEGYKVVTAIKKDSRENKLMYMLRTLYYKVIRKLSDVEQIEHFTGFGLYDRSFLNVLRNLDDTTPFLRGIVAELGPKRKEIFYEQQKRRAGKTSFTFYKYYDAAMLSVTSYTKIGLRIATFVGFLFSVIVFLIGFVYLILKLIYWDRFPAGMTPVLIGVFFIGAIQLFFIGLLGEYILNINTRIMKRPLVVEERRINFD